MGWSSKYGRKGNCKEPLCASVETTEIEKRERAEIPTPRRKLRLFIMPPLSYIEYKLPSRKLRCLQKSDHFKRKFHLPSLFFRGHVGFPWCISNFSDPVSSIIWTATGFPFINSPSQSVFLIIFGIEGLPFFLTPEWNSLCFIQANYGQLIFQRLSCTNLNLYTLSETNIFAPEIGWLED